jgi:hypothetical protein
VNWSGFSKHDIAAALGAAGFSASSDEVTIERREDRWLATLSGNRIAWFPANASGAGQLRTERRVLQLLDERCKFLAPRVIHQSPDGWDVRRAVPGRCEPWLLYERASADTGLARRIGTALGAILLEQHTRIRASDVAAWLPHRPEWPEPSVKLRRDLSEVIDDRTLLGELEAVLDIYDRTPVDDHDRVLVHGDLGLHNIAVDEHDEVRGVFDYGGSCWTDRHHDFRYLVFDLESDAALEAALAAYEPALGRSLSRARIRLYNAACAIGFLAYRRGVPADTKSCGRTLAQDLKWVRGALARL